MRLNSLILSFGLCILALALWAGCGRRNTFPDTPAIEFESARLVPGVNFSQDSLIVSIRFRDGNGDLGLEPSERMAAPFAMYPNPNNKRIFNMRTYNWFLTLYMQREDGSFDTLRHTTAIDSAGQYSYITSFPFFGAFPTTRDMNQGESIEGVLRYGSPGIFTSPQPPFPPLLALYPGRRWYVSLRIMDRAGNYSNRVDSPVYTYAP